MRINKVPFFLYFFFLLLLLSRQETLTGQTILVFDDGIPVDQRTDTSGDAFIDGNIADTIIEVVHEEVVADIWEQESIEIIDIVIPQEEQEGVEESVQESDEEGVEEVVEAPYEEMVKEQEEVEPVQEINEEVLEEIAVPLNEVIVEEQEAVTIEKFMTELPYDTVVVIGENAPTRALIGALHLAGKFGLRVVKDSTVEDIATVHAIALGLGSVNSVSASVLENGAVASDEGAYFIYEDKGTGTIILVVAGETPQETRKAVRDLMKY